MAASNEESSPTRRDFIDWTIGACSLIGAGAAGVPALVYLFPVTKEGPVNAREEVGDEASWLVWESRKVSVGEKPVLVVRTDKGFVALSAVCTHLGCLVEFDSANLNVICPCHAASFDLAGQVTGGPPPRPLAVYQVSTVQGKVFVSAGEGIS